MGGGGEWTKSKTRELRQNKKNKGDGNNKQYAKQAIHNTVILTVQWPVVQLSFAQLMEKPNSRERVPAPGPTPIYKLSRTPVVRNISIGQLGLAAWLCSIPALVHLFVSWTWETERSPWFLRNNWKHQCLINIIPILYPKHNSYWEEN